MVLSALYISIDYIYRAPKIKNKKYPIRMYWVLKELKYRNAKYIYRWHLIEVPELDNLIL